MPSDVTVGNGLFYTLYVVQELFFKWVPGTITSIVGQPGSYIPADYQIPVITQPITVPQILTFLQLNTQPGVYDTLLRYWTAYVVIVSLISLFCLMVIIYCWVRVYQVRAMEHRRFAALQQTVVAEDAPKTHMRWNRIKDQAASDSEQGWRLAILEADIMLNELLDLLAVRGATIAEKLQSVNKMEFTTIDLAWEAHRARNKIAHEGMSHELSGYEARRIISMYEQVFREFGLVE